MRYQAPLNELNFALRTHGKLADVLQLPATQDLALDADTVAAVLDEAAKFAEQSWAHTNRTGDLHGAKLANGKVHTHADLARAYREFCEAGWAGLRAPAEFGGQGLPAVLSAACEEMWCAANLSLSLLPMLTLGAVDAIYKHGSEEQKAAYLPKMCTGEWSGTMNLSEPSAAARCGGGRAGHLVVYCAKIFAQRRWQLGRAQRRLRAGLGAQTRHPRQPHLHHAV